MRRYIGEMIGELRVDKDLLKAVHEDDEPETIGPCMGKCCVNYECPQCYIQAKNPATGKYVITHRTQCNAMF